MRRIHSLIALSLASALVVAPRASAADDVLAATRLEFRRAYSAATNPANSGAGLTANDSEALRGYALYPYLEQARIRSALSATVREFAAVDGAAETFLAAHDKEVVAAELRRAWFTNLAKRQEWERLLSVYRESNDSTLQCYALAARVALQRTEGLQTSVAAMWASAPDSRPACESAFNWLRAQGGETDVLIERRARLALGAGNVGFARQLIALLPKNLAEPLDIWADLLERSRAAIDAAIASPKKPIEPQALLDGWTRLARSDASAAIQRLKPLVRARKLPPETASRFALELGLSLAWNRRPEALEYFAKVRPVDFDDRASEWYARAALWAGDLKRAASVIESMSPTLAKQTKWRYWSARVAERRGKKESAQQQYTALQNDDNYYAALAAARLQKPYTPKPQPLAVNEELQTSLAQQQSFVRARELQQFDAPELRAASYDEWRRGYATLDSGARQQAIILASRWGWYDQAILTAAQQGSFDDYELLYPRPFDPTVEDAAEIVRLPPALVYGLLRQESLYRVDAQSGPGAKGLMQLIQETAGRTARRWPQIAKALSDPKNLFDPMTSIYLGAARFKDMVDRYDGKFIIALAAYNAGPVAAERWFPKAPMDIDVWIENIPYNETRVYVQRILWHSVVFGWVMNHAEQNTTDWLMTVGGK